MPLDVVLETLREDRVEVEHGAPLEAGALPPGASTDQDVGEEDQESVSLLHVSLLQVWRGGGRRGSGGLTMRVADTSRVFELTISVTML